MATEQTALPLGVAGQGAPILDVDYLIVGAGPAGASLACFLGKYGSSSPDITFAISAINRSRGRTEGAHHQCRSFHGPYASSSYHQPTGAGSVHVTPFILGSRR